MLLDLRELAGRIDRQVDVCIVGAGVAGIVAARRLLAAGRDVLLLESGGVDFERDVADLNAGTAAGQPYYPLRDARLRFFGGTTAIWGGRCAELDPIDLAKRDWVPGSGWPIEWDDLQAYYRQARALFGISAEPARPETLRANNVPLPDFDPKLLAMPLWSFDPQFDRFTIGRCRDLVEHPRCTIVTHATVTAIATTDDAGQVTGLTAAAVGGGANLRIVPRATVLAAGGIENARLLLASRATVPAGLGNQHDQVGRCFMEHPHARGGRIVGGDVWRLLKAFGRRHRVDGRDLAALITPSAELQRRERILNTSLTIVARQPEDARQFWGMRAYGSLKHDISPTKAGRRAWMMTKQAATWAQRTADPLRPWLLNKLRRAELTLLVRAEQAPDPASRITLDGTQDALGMPRARLHWQLGEIDKRSVTVLVDTLGQELERLGMGRVERASWLDDPAETWRTDPLVSSHPIGGYHHIGTTRMSHDPRDGVVDGAGRLHGTDNLWVVGSSVFPTSSWANPTLTIAALALRTADRITSALIEARRPEARTVAAA